MRYSKVDGKHNPADLCTKYLTQSAIDSALDKVEMKFKEGRANKSLEANMVRMTEGCYGGGMPAAVATGGESELWELIGMGAIGEKRNWADLQEEEENNEVLACIRSRAT